MSEEVQKVQVESVSKFSHSDTIGKLAEALAKAHGQFKTVIKSAENPYFKSSYADLSALIDATQEGLTANGLALVQSPGQIVNGRVHVTSILMHSSGEWLSDELAMPMSKTDAQGAGSAITYARRYAYQSLLNVAGEEDDDGNAATGKTQADRKGSSTDVSDKGPINPTQQRAFWSAATQGGKTKAHVAEYFETIGIRATEEMPKLKFDAAIKWAIKPLPIPADMTETLEKSVEMVRPTQQEFKRIFAAANKKHIPEEDVKRYAYDTFAVDSMTKLNVEQAQEVMEWIETV